MTPKLFTSVKVGDLELKHRVVYAPLTRLRAINHVPNTPLFAEYYKQRSQRPGTLIITEGTFISPQAGGMDGPPGIWSQEQVEAWKPVFKAIHDEGSYVYVQLWALGRQADPAIADKDGIQVVSSSPVKLTDGEGATPPTWALGLSEEEMKKKDRTPHALTKAEIKQYIDWYVQGAKNALAAGADGVEIHSANGYLLDQFLHENVNQRTDEYGGSIENRARFPLEVLNAVVDAIGASKVGIRFAPWGSFGNVNYGVSPIPQWSYIVAEIEKLKRQGKEIAYVHALEPRANWREDNVRDAPHYLNDFIPDIWSGIFIRSGNLAPQAVKFAEEHDDRTLLAIGRHFIANPDIVDKFENNVPLTPYDRSTFYTGGAHGYTDYPVHY